METDMVSWLPPKHPRANLSESAAKLREKLLNPSVGVAEISQSTYRNEDSDKRRSTKNRDRNKEYKEKEEKRGKYDEKDMPMKKPRKDNDIDPMDPAAYSDVPQAR